MRLGENSERESEGEEPVPRRLERTGDEKRGELGIVSLNCQPLRPVSRHELKPRALIRPKGEASSTVKQAEEAGADPMDLIGSRT